MSQIILFETIESYWYNGCYKTNSLINFAPVGTVPCALAIKNSKT